MRLKLESRIRADLLAVKNPGSLWLSIDAVRERGEAEGVKAADKYKFYLMISMPLVSINTSIKKTTQLSPSRKRYNKYGQPPFIATCINVFMKEEIDPVMISRSYHMDYVTV